MEAPVIKETGAKKLVGKKLRMSIANYNVAALFRSFMPFRNIIPNKTSSDIFDLQIYDASFSFLPFDIHKEFDKWAALEVSDFSSIPEGMETLLLPAGKYAVFVHRGSASEAERTFSYIFGTWLPSSGYQVDHRPHFTVIGAKYKNNSPDSEEEVWIPIK
jgi:AraC family transcriptional regulator